jgi:hypothetical protein
MACDTVDNLAAQLLAAKLNVVAQALVPLETSVVSEAQNLAHGSQLQQTGAYAKKMTQPAWSDCGRLRKGSIRPDPTRDLSARQRATGATPRELIRAQESHLVEGRESVGRVRESAIA